MQLQNIQYSNIHPLQLFPNIPPPSITLPIYFPPTTTPHFIYLLTDNTANHSINLIIHTKAVHKQAELNQVQHYKIEP
ncbi:hypothetical protein, partial [Bacillus velezensis]|uniref:hypothetical protein n=1 Tax=Bacillus velezensis TaxID=492670 RepID=UPI0037BEF727